MAESTDLVLVERGEGIALVTLNRPGAMNALSSALRRELARVMLVLEMDDGVRAIILTGAGERAFSAGLDLKELGSQQGALSAAGHDSAEGNPVKAIEQCSKPVIGAVNGVAITGGFELALACDILIASRNAHFADTHVRVGVLPGWGLSQKLQRIVGPSRAKQMALTGNFIDAATAERWGLVNAVTAPDALIAAARAVALDIASADPAIVRGQKALIDEGYHMTLGAALAHEQAVSASHNAGVSTTEMESRRAGVQARGRMQ